MLDKTKDVNVEPNRSFSAAHLNKRLPNPPKRDSSLGALNDQRLKYLETPQPVSHDKGISNERLNRHHTLGVSGADELTPTLHSVPEEQSLASMTPEPSVIDRTKQPLPPLPPQANIKRDSALSMKPFRSSRMSVPSTISSERRSSKRSSHSTRSPLRSSGSTIDNHVGLESSVSEANWQDDVDFCYEQQAESTCNFDWQNPNPSQVERSSISESNGSTRSFIRVPHSSLDMSTPWRPDRKSIEAFVPRTYPPSGMYLRSVSTGHHTKNSSAHPLRNSINVPPTWRPTYNAAQATSQANGLGSKEGTPTPHLASTIPHVSSSTGEIKSILPGKARWTFTSTHSVPELLQRRSRERRSIPKTSISQPLETLPQSPADVNDTNGHESAQSEAAPTLDGMTIRRPESSFERTALQAAGKAVQRSRPPPTGNRLSRIESVEQFDDERAGWI